MKDLTREDNERPNKTRTNKTTTNKPRGMTKQDKTKEDKTIILSRAEKTMRRTKQHNTLTRTIQG